MSELAREASFAETGEKAKELMDLVLPALEGAGVRYWLDLGCYSARSVGDGLTRGVGMWI